jgi:excisionase family DNA binding protein
MTYTLGMAARATGLSKSTIHRAIKNGRISATRTDAWSFAIDPAELHRVFPPAQDEISSGNGSVTPFANWGLFDESPEILVRL